MLLIEFLENGMANFSRKRERTSDLPSDVSLTLLWFLRASGLKAKAGTRSTSIWPTLVWICSVSAGPLLRKGTWRGGRRQY